MTILAIETSTDIASAALLEGESLRASFAFRGRRDVCQRLLPNIEAMMDEAGIEAKALSAIAVGRGPGSFTGIRFGVATAKGLALALGVPLFGISTLAACAYPARGLAGVVCALIPAHGDELYAGIFHDANPAAPIAERMFSAAELVAHLSNLDEPVALVPTSAQVREMLPLDRMRVEYRCLPPEVTWPLACWVGRLAQARLAAGDAGDGVGLAPVYLRPSQAEMEARQGM